PRARLALAACLAAGLAAPPLAAQVPISAEVFVTGLERPVGLVAPRDTSDRLMILEQGTGRVRVVQGGTLLETPFLDLGGLVKYSGEQGLLGLAFHPQYNSNGRFFVLYTDLASSVVVEEYLAEPPSSNVANPASAVRLMTVPKPFIQHNGGTLAFYGDGTLLVTLGDGGSAFDPLGNAQNLGSLLGKVLRIDVDAPPQGHLAYAVPVDNPFVGVPGARDEILAYGLRNPWRLSVDEDQGDLWLGDVGQQLAEEIDRIPLGGGGENFGWRCLEGDLDTGLCAGPPPAAVPPIVTYDHNEGCAVVGGHVYRGIAIPELWGTYFYGDHCTGRVWSFVWDGVRPTQWTERTNQIPGFQGSISSFGEDTEGELYIAYYFTGEVRKIVPAPVVPDCDGDGTPDATELLTGEAFDVNGDATPDSCQHLLTSTDLVAGQVATFQFIGANPAQPVAFLFSLRGIGPGWCFWTPPVCLDIQPYLLSGVPTISLLGLDLADAQGAATIGVPIPMIQFDQPIAFQALAVDGPWSEKSNPIQKLIH
ncbi:MAG TPA: PQQ-dependent sugar dehydrogenase, partial [Planctomycetota bacterium]|nr:PQQ-dependent sugar dehydrogenase [Planctomycetota bacterium]